MSAPDSSPPAGDPSEEIVVYESALPAERTVGELVERQDKIRTAMKMAMREGVHYGRIPGVPKPTLFKAGAETLCSLFMFDPEYDTTTNIDADNHFHAKSKATLYHIPTGNRVASGGGYCSTAERRYAFQKDGNPTPARKRPGRGSSGSCLSSRPRRCPTRAWM